MINYITNNPRPNFTGSILNFERGRIKCYEYLKDLKEICIDFETTSLDTITCKPLLVALGDEKEQFVFDLTTTDLEFLGYFQDVLFIGHNIKYDYQVLKQNYSIQILNLYDTMIANQRIFQNLYTDDFKRNELGYGHSLKALVYKYCNVTLSKEVRDTFFNSKLKEYNFTNDQIIYAATDIQYLQTIKRKQEEFIKSYDLDFLLSKIEFPLISVLGDCELEGFAFDTESWLANVRETEIKVKALIDKLNEYYSKELDFTGESKAKKVIEQPEQQLITLFGEVSEREFYSSYKSKTIKVDRKTGKVKKTNGINWSSDVQLLKVFANMKQPAPLQGKAYELYKGLIPFVSPDGKLNKGIGIDSEGNTVPIPEFGEDKQGFTTDKTAFNKYLVDFPNSPIRDFIKTLGEYKQLDHEITGFGENFVQKVNRKTGRIHTIYRQCDAVNGRLQSGGGNKQKDKYNSQNIPRHEKFRKCFRGGKYLCPITNTEQDYSVATVDLTGAEVTIMCDKGNDTKLYEWAVVNDDSHSPMVQNIWRNIYLYRAGIAANVWTDCKSFSKAKSDSKILTQIEFLSKINKVVEKWWNLSQTFIVSKEVNKPFRQAGKNGTFGGVYGMKAKKAQETYNNTDVELARISKDFEPCGLTLEEGKVVLFAQREAIPITFEMVENNARLGLSVGRIVLNDRTKSHIWLPEVAYLLRELKTQGEVYYLGNGKYRTQNGQEHTIEFKTVGEYEGQCRNVPISGTQADMVKEAMVKIASYVRKYKLDCALLSQVHDEVVYRCPKHMDGKSVQWQTNPEYCTFTYNDGKIERVSFPQFVKLTMQETANLYLKNVKMRSSIEVHDHWIK